MFQTLFGSYHTQLMTRVGASRGAASLLQSVQNLQLESSYEMQVSRWLRSNLSIVRGAMLRDQIPFHECIFLALTGSQSFHNLQRPTLFKLRD